MRKIEEAGLALTLGIRSLQRNSSIKRRSVPQLTFANAMRRKRAQRACRSGSKLPEREGGEKKRKEANKTELILKLTSALAILNSKQLATELLSAIL